MKTQTHIFDQVYQKMESGVLVLNSKLELLFWNDWLVNFTAIPERDVVGKNLLTLFQNIDQKIIQTLKQTFQADQTYIIPSGCKNYLIPIPNESVLADECKFIPQRIELIPIINDVGEKWIAVIIQNQTELNSEGNELDAERSKVVMEMAKALAHKLNQPLQGILGYAELLQIENHNAENETLEKIIECAEKIRDVVSQIQRLEKYESQAYVRDVRIVNLDKV